MPIDQLAWGVIVGVVAAYVVRLLDHVAELALVPGRKLTQRMQRPKLWLLRHAMMRPMPDDGFEIYVKGSTPPTRGPRISILKRGAISFNEAAFGMLGSPAAVQLLFNTESRVVGVRAVEEQHPSAHPVRTNQGARSYVVGCGGFFQHFDIRYDHSRRYTPRFEANTLLFDVDAPVVEQPSNDSGVAHPV